MPPAVFFGTAAGVLVIGLVIGLVVVLGSGGSPKTRRPGSGVGRPAAQGESPSSYSSSPTTEVFRAIEKRSADAAPLTVDEVFPQNRKLTGPDGKGGLTLRDKRIDADCAEAVWGPAVGDVLREGDCTQAVRGTFSDERYTVLVTIFNVGAAEDANRLVDVLGRGDGSGFVRPLGAFGGGFSMARGLAMGHYGVVGWVWRRGGEGNAQDEALLSLLVESGGPQALLDRAARSQ